MKGLRIGKIKLKNGLFLAPLVNVSDLPYRLLCRRCGAGMAYTEMLYINSILHENEKTEELMKTCGEDSPVGLQITGNGVEEFEKFVKSKKWKKYDVIDLNCGCPSIKITGSEAGSYLLQNPEKIGEMIRILKKTGRAVTAKIRLGFKKNNVLRVAREIERAGADAITVHARLAVDGREVGADWKWIAKVKNSVKIPVIGNGDLFSGEDVDKMFRETNCDGVMIARGAIGDPLIFSRVLDYLKSGKEEGRDWKENWKLFGEYLKLAKKYDVIDLSRIKFLGGRFLRGFKGASKLREELVGCKTVVEVVGFAKKISCN